MVEFQEVDFESWHRTDLFRHYIENWSGCLMTFDIEVDVTETVRYHKEHEEKFAPMLYYLAAKSLGEQANFRMGIKDDKVGFWNELWPFYPVLNTNEDITFHYVPWKDSFSEYYGDYLAEGEKNKDCTKAVCGEIPGNFIMMSIMPYMNFTSCSYSLRHAKWYLAPALFFGKYNEKNGRLMMPVSLTINHAAADGYHVQKFFESFGEKLLNPEKWLR